MLAQYGVGARRAAGRRGRPGYDDADAPYTPAWQEAITGVPRARPQRGSAASSPRTPRSRSGRSMIVMGAGTNHWFHSDTIYRAFLDADHPDRLPGRQRRRLGALRRPGEGAGRSPARPRSPTALDWNRPPRNMIQTAYWYLHTDQFRYDQFGADTLSATDRRGPARRASRTADVIAQSARMGWMPSYPTFDRNPLDLADDARRRRASRSATTSSSSSSPATSVRRRGPGRPGELPARPLDLAGQPARLLGQGQRVLPQAPARHRLVAARHRDAAGGQRPDGRASGATRRPRASSTCC